MNVLIVDDEYFIVKGIVKKINWSRVGVDAVFAAYSMKQAQDIFLQKRVDILISDIEMPKGTGLDLIEWAYRSGYNPASLLLTGHKRFDYAQKAIHMQCINYILKPVEHCVLEDEIQKAVKKVQYHAQQNDAKKIIQYWNSEKNNLVESFWRKLLTSSAPLSDRMLKESLERIDIPLDITENSFYMALIYISSPDTAPVTKEGIPFDTLQPIISQILCVEETIPLIMAAENTLIAICPAESYSDFAEFYAACNSLLSDLTAAAELKYAMYLGDRVSMNQVRESFQILCKCKDNIMFHDSIVLPVHAITSPSPFLSESALSDIPLDQWLEWLLQLKSEKIINDINKYLNAAYYPISIIKTIYLGIMKTVFSALENRHISPKEIFPKLLLHTEIMQKISSKDTFMHWISSILQNTEELLNADKNSDSIVDTVKKHIREYIHSPELNRSFLAAQIHLNPDYLSYLFHKQSGQTLSTYILNERIMLAKKLLIASNKSLQEIIEMTGFSNNSYFHKQFKKLTGVTPHQYRRNN